MPGIETWAHLPPGGQFEPGPGAGRQALRGVPIPDATGSGKGSVHVTFLLNFLDEFKRRIP